MHLPPQDVVLEHSGALGKRALSEKLFRPILDSSAASPEPVSVAEIEKAIGRDRERTEQLISSLLLLSGKGSRHPSVIMRSSSPKRAQRGTFKRWGITWGSGVSCGTVSLSRFS